MAYFVLWHVGRAGSKVKRALITFWAAKTTAVVATTLLGVLRLLPSFTTRYGHTRPSLAGCRRPDAAGTLTLDARSGEAISLGTMLSTLSVRLPESPRVDGSESNPALLTLPPALRLRMHRRICFISPCRAPLPHGRPAASRWRLPWRSPTRRWATHPAFWCTPRSASSPFCYPSYWGRSSSASSWCQRVPERGTQTRCCHASSAAPGSASPCYHATRPWSPGASCRASGSSSCSISRSRPSSHESPRWTPIASSWSAPCSRSSSSPQPLCTSALRGLTLSP